MGYGQAEVVEALINMIPPSLCLPENYVGMGRTLIISDVGDRRFSLLTKL